METTDYVSYLLAIKLKAAGFNEPCGKSVKIIPGTEREEWDDEECQWYTVQDIEYYPKITLWQAQKWLREKKGIAINVIAHGCHDKYREGKYHWEEIHLPNSKEKGPQWIDWFIYGKHPLFDTYEEALSDGLSQMLELIEKKGE